MKNYKIICFNHQNFINIQVILITIIYSQQPNMLIVLVIDFKSEPCSFELINELLLPNSIREGSEHVPQHKVPKN